MTPKPLQLATDECEQLQELIKGHIRLNYWR